MLVAVFDCFESAYSSLYEPVKKQSSHRRCHLVAIKACLVLYVARYALATLRACKRAYYRCEWYDVPRLLIQIPPPPYGGWGDFD